LSFGPAAEQSKGRVQFISRGSGYTLMLASDEALLALKSRFLDPTPASIDRTRYRGQTNRAPVLDMRLSGADPEARSEGIDELPGKSNYLIGNDLSQWKLNLANYGAVRYDAIYPGVNLFYYGNQGRLEYDFVVAPGASAAPVAWSFASRSKGSTSTSTVNHRIDANGDLVLTIDSAEIRFNKPIAYQLPREVPASLVMAQSGRTFSMDGRPRTLVESRWVLRPGGLVGFETGAYDHSRALVIDPTLVYSTFLGGSSEDVGTGVAVDSSGSAYITGSTFSTDFPMAGHGPQNQCMDCAATEPNVFISKLTADGSALVYSTYIGGTGYGTDYQGDAGYGIAVDSQGNAFVAGATDSADFPVTPGAFKTTCPSCKAGSSNAFVLKLNASGSSLLYSTYLGGTGNSGGNGDGALAIAIDSTGDAFVTGYALSNDFPLSTGALQTSCKSCSGGTAVSFVTKISPDGSSYFYSTFLGGSNLYGDGATGDIANSIAVDASGDVFVAGEAHTFDFPVTTGAFQTSRGLAGSLGFVAKINGDATALVYATYLGGSTNGSISSLAIDASGNAYVAGNTSSPDFPSTQGAYQAACSGVCDDAFVTKLNPQGSALAFSTFLGGTGSDKAFGIAVDSKGNSYVTGETSSSDFPHTSDAVQSLCDQSSARCNGDVFLTEVNPSGTDLVYSTFLGGDGEDTGQAIALDSSDNVYLTGSTLSANFPVSSNPFQKNCGANCKRASLDDPLARDAFIAKIGTAASAGAPSVTLAPTSIAFGNQAVGKPSSPQSATFTNTGTVALTSLAITITGANSGDFSQTNTCGTTLAAGAWCSIGVTFNPAASGSRAASIQVSDNAASKPQTLALSGTGTSALGLAIASGSSSSATIPAGSTAPYSLSLGGAGYGGTVALNCSGAPQKSTCSVPASVIVSAATASTVQVSVSTTASSLAQLERPIGVPLALGTSALALLLLPRRIRRHVPLRILGLVVIAAAALSLSGCGGLGRLVGTGTGGQKGTPSGDYTLTVTASGGSLTESTQLTLHVQ
jgi:hypothetical protein